MLKYCLITGASNGLGKYLSNILYKNNFNLILIYNKNDIDISAFKYLSNNKNTKIIKFKCDLTSEIQVENLCNTLLINYDINILINNAAIHGDIREFNKLSNIDSFKDVINVNLMAPIAITKSVLKNMIKKPFKLSIFNHNTLYYRGFYSFHLTQKCLKNQKITTLYFKKIELLI